MLKQIIEAIKKNNKFVIVTHINPDGDAAGSMAAITAYLRDIGKEVHAYFPGPLMPTYAFLNQDGDMQQYEKADDPDSRIGQAEVILMVDANEWTRTEKMESLIRKSKALKIIIDHHPLEKEDADFTWVDTVACSAGEMVFRLIDAMGGTITEKIGKAIYVTILTDTGSFRFSNTTAESHEVTSELIRTGVRTSEIYQEVYECNPEEKIKLLGHCLENLNLEFDNKMVWISVSLETMKKYNAENWMLEGVVEVARTIAGVEITALLKEIDSDTVKASLRSRSKVNVNALLRPLGGGGHPRAAGCKLKMSLGEAEKLIVQKAKEALAASMDFL